MIMQVSTLNPAYADMFFSHWKALKDPFVDLKGYISTLPLDFNSAILSDPQVPGLQSGPSPSRGLAGSPCMAEFLDEFWTVIHPDSKLLLQHTLPSRFSGAHFMCEHTCSSVGGARCVCACCMWCVHVSGVHPCEGQRPRLGVLSLSPLYVWDGPSTEPETPGFSFHWPASSWVPPTSMSPALAAGIPKAIMIFPGCWGSELHLPTPQPTLCLVSLSWKVWQ